MGSAGVILLKNSRTKVLHVLAGGWIGGAERFVEWFLGSENKNKDIIHEVVFLYQGGAVQLNLEKMGIATSILNWKTGYSILGRWRLIEFIFTCQPDIIQFHDRSPLVKIFVKCIFPSKPLVQFCHGFESKPWLAQMGQIIDDRFIDLVIGNSDYTLTTYNRIFHRNKKIKKVYLGLALDQYRTSVWEEQPPRAVNKHENFIEIIFIGRLQEYKGVLDLPALAMNLQTLGVNDFRIHIVGEGPSLGKITDLAKSLDVHEKIKFWGAQENVLPFLKRADILVFPSWCDEAFGLVPLEALSCGLSVVAYNSGAVKEVIGKAPGVVIVEKKNVKEMAIAIANIVESQMYPDISECIDYLDKNFNIDRTIFEIEKIYEDIIAEHS